jgi:SPP1 gp7 family putative phage head morphogenesis protein
MKNPSKKYWEDRAAGRMVSYTAKAESTADTLGKAYYATARYLQGEANGILSTFADKFELSIAEAETMLKNAPGKSMFEQMKTALATCTDEQKKRELETLLSSPAYAHRIGRLNDLDSKISDMCSRLANAEIGVDTAHLGDIIQSAYMQTVFDVTKGADYRAAFDLIPESRVKAILSTNWSGQMFSERVWDNTNALADGLKHDMLVGIMAGKSEQHMADDIMNRCGVGAFEARRLVRTETTCVANMAELDGYRELDIDEYEFSACLDSRTSDLCRELDGKVFKRNSAQAGVNLPPMHPFCRSTTLPVLPSEEDLDKELAELGDEIGADVDFDEWERNLQQGEDGKWRYVAGSAGKPMRFASNGVDKSGESGIIKAGSDEVALENQRYGRNKSTTINNTYIESGEYRRKFDNMTDNSEVNRSLYNCAKTALKHRSGTAYEDMYWIDSETGRILLSVTDSTDERTIIYTDKIKKAILSQQNAITLHTHPSSMPPSISDLNSCFKNGYKKGFIACHNGKIFGYTANEEVNERIYNMYIESFLKDGFDEYDAQMKALNKLSQTYDISVWEVLCNE